MLRGVAPSQRLNRKKLAATLGVQHDVISRRQARLCGLSEEALKHRLRPGGPWQRILPGTYLTVTGRPTSVQRDMAALLYAGPGSVMTGLAALRGQGLGGPAPGATDVLIPAEHQRKNAGFVRVWRTERLPENTVVLGRRRYAPPARAVADAARWMADLRTVRALVAGAVQRGECPVYLLVRELDEGPVRGSALLRQALGEAAAGVASGAEADLADLIKRGKLPPPVLNVRLYRPDDTLVAVPDAWWQEAGVAAEVDSREWHFSPADWERTMRRHAEMSSLGIIVLHFTPRQIRTEPDRVIAAIADALRSGASRPPLPVVTRRAA